MRLSGFLLFLSLALLPLSASAAPMPAAPMQRTTAQEADAFLGTLVHLTLKGTHVNVRGDIGQAAVTQCNTGDELIAYADTEEGKGLNWYRILYFIEHQEETAYWDPKNNFNLAMPPVICADYVKASPLTQFDKDRIANDRFGFLDIAPSGLAQIELDRDVAGYSDTAKPYNKEAPDILIESEIPLLLFTTPYKISGMDDIFLTLWEKVDERRIRPVGHTTLGVLRGAVSGARLKTLNGWLSNYGY
ncbi:MAG: hypothetical protein J5855_07735 [Mailhella sp.]|nr:hypothetical protein [Mailhella sp.]